MHVGPDGTHISICAGVHAVQGSSCYKTVSALRQGVHGDWSDLLLLQEMQGNLSGGAQARVLSVISSGTPGRDSCSWCCIQGSTQRGDSAEGTRISGKYDRRTTRPQSSTSGSMAEGKQGSHQRGEARLAQIQEGRSGIRGEAEGRACQILRQEETGSRTLCAYTGAAKSSEADTGAQGEGKGISCQEGCGEAHQRAGGICQTGLLGTVPAQTYGYEETATAGLYP